MEVHLDPARSACNVLAIVLCPPAFHKTNSNGAHLCKLKDGFKSLINTLSKQLGKVLITEDFQRAAWRDLTNSSRMKLMRVVTVSALDKEGSITKTLCKYLPTDIKEVDSLTNVTTNILNGCSMVDIREHTKAESIRIHARICVTINNNMSVCGMKCFTDSLI